MQRKGSHLSRLQVLRNYFYSKSEGELRRKSNLSSDP